MFSSCAGVIKAKERSSERKVKRKHLREQNIQVGADHFHFWEGGSGQAVVLVHGFGGSAMWQWHEQVEPLIKNYRLIIPDLLFFGGSTTKKRDFSLEHQVSGLAALFDKLEVSHACVVGLSYGGFVAWELALRYPELVSHLVLVDSPGPIFNKEAYEAMIQRFGVKNVEDILVPDDPEDIQRLLDVAYYKPPKISKALRKAILRTMFLPYQFEHRELLRRLIIDHLVPQPHMHIPEQPVSLLWGKYDPIFPLTIAQDLARNFDTEVQVIDRARHAPQLEYPKLFNPLLLTQLRAHCGDGDFSM